MIDQGVISRRAVIDRMLGLAAATPLVLLGLSGAARAEDAAACFDPEKLPASSKSLRKSLGFVTPAPEPAKACGGCVFFTKGAGDCGKCAILSGGPVTAKSWCRSWAKKG